ncbi:MAG: B12-binding domain-containing protein [Anaerolineae bacterium]
MEIVDNLIQYLQAGQAEGARRSASEALEAGYAVTELIEELTRAMRQMGDRFGRMEIFLPELLMASIAMRQVMEVLEPELEKIGISQEKRGTVVIGTVEGDLHEIGKDIVITMLRVNGFEVHDLGANVNALDFIRAAEKVGADIIGASALMTTTMPGQREIIELLKAMGLRDKYHVIVGGAPVSQEWTDHIGADSWGENATRSAALLIEVMAQKRKADATL